MSTTNKEKAPSVKSKILTLLEENRGSYISGGQLATELGVSRTAIWKAIQSLQNSGFKVEAVTNKGYMLMDETDVLSKEGLSRYITAPGINIEYHDEIDSTNLELKRRANEPEGTVIVAGMQTGGMGRLGRSFSSPSSTGAYFSIMLKPTDIPNDKVTLLTTIAALSVCEAIEKHTDRTPSIKWVNDVFIDGKKVNGTLTQASFSMENLSPEYVIVGIGLNVYEPEGGFPDEIKDIAGPIALERVGDLKNKLVSEIINRYFYYYNNFAANEFIDEYKKRCFVIEKTVNLVSPNKSIKATILDIDDLCRLKVRYEEGELAGTEDIVSTGEISLRL